MENVYKRVKERFEAAKKDKSFMGDIGSLLKGLERVFQVRITDQGSFYFVVKNKNIELEKGEAKNPNATIELSSETFEALEKNEADPMGAFLAGNIAVQGDIGELLRFVPLIEKLKG
ncbi:MAG: SCP2 sterol-binding domain-containing protein [Candidatus Aenigmarchaeota archaeon]|nr:SCP2 sterol-binding domain-containing protein [Candidatus Aenigmarchaeota archaeon]